MQNGTENKRSLSMDLYFSPLACSMATRIALYEAGAEAGFVPVDVRAKRVGDADFLAVNPMGQVPVLRMEDGRLLTENTAILQYVADRFPESGLAPAPSAPERPVLNQWLAFVTSELHKLVFAPLLAADAPQGARDFAMAKAGPRLAYLDRHLTGRRFVLDRFTVADAYLVTVLNWADHARLDLAPYPAITAYLTAMRRHPSVRRALSEELALYQEAARRAA
ncbi:glutathione S-transferase N-terminal domain-containing protein [Roseomonas sp. CCTCC AB2023176]|uniref:glutathione S-transferase N-terminal domain-containing protein n=1 Tax=Roseomonas sp. CCTCC AB2023176 TaxID=3342640 RepID=UPI0035E26FF2